MKVQFESKKVPLKIEQKRSKRKSEKFRNTPSNQEKSHFNFSSKKSEKSKKQNESIAKSQKEKLEMIKKEIQEEEEQKKEEFEEIEKEELQSISNKSLGEEIFQVNPISFQRKTNKSEELSGKKEKTKKRPRKGSILKRIRKNEVKPLPVANAENRPFSVKKRRGRFTGEGIGKAFVERFGFQIKREFF